jgi:hypothetical protein
MALKDALAFLAVRDVEEGTRWYKMLLGREPDTQPMKVWLNGNSKPEAGCRLTRTSSLLGNPR